MEKTKVEKKSEKNQVAIDWARKNTKLFGIRLCEGVDGDMIAFLNEKQNLTAYLKCLIRSDMKKNGLKHYRIKPEYAKLWEIEGGVEGRYVTMEEIEEAAAILCKPVVELLDQVDEL